MHPPEGLAGDDYLGRYVGALAVLDQNIYSTRCSEAPFPRLTLRYLSSAQVCRPAADCWAIAHQTRLVSRFSAQAL